MIRFALGGLPLLAFLVWIAALYFHQGERRNAVLQAAALLGIWVVIGTEAFSAIDQLNFFAILVWWIIGLVIGVLVLSSDQTVATAFASRSVPPGRPKWDYWLLWPLLIGVVGIVLTAAILSPPNNYDSYSYHLPRMVMWLQHGNVKFYSTVNLRQLMMAPFTEYVGVHLMALSNSDRWINLVQFAAMLVTFCGISLLAERLGGDRSVQVLACLVFAASPSVFQEASNTKNDLMVAMWVVIAIWWTVQLLDGAKFSLFRAILLGSAIGCGADSKGTGPLFMIPIVGVLCWVVCRQFSKQKLKMLCLVGAIALAINAPQFGRNYLAFGHIGGPTPRQGGYPLYNESHTPSVLLSNVTRMLAWEAALGPDPVDPPPGPLAELRTRFDDHLFAALRWFHEHVLHLGINDPITTTPYSAYGNLHFRGTDEDRAGSPMTLLLILLLPAAIWLARKKIDAPLAWLTAAVAVAGFLIFNWSVKWQEWHTRYFIPQIALFAPVIAAAFSARLRILSAALVGLLMWAALIPTIEKNPRALLGPGGLLARDYPTARLNYHYELNRRFTYFGHNRDFMEVARLVDERKMQCVGLATDGDFPDYAVMCTIKYRNHHLPNFEYINPHVRIPGSPFQTADVIVADPRIKHLVDQKTGVEYSLYDGNTMFNILLPKNRPPS